MYLKSKLHKPIDTMNYEQFGQQRSVESKDCRLRRQTTYFFYSKGIEGPPGNYIPTPEHKQLAGDLDQTVECPLPPTLPY